MQRLGKPNIYYFLHHPRKETILQEVDHNICTPDKQNKDINKPEKEKKQ